MSSQDNTIINILMKKVLYLEDRVHFFGNKNLELEENLKILNQKFEFFSHHSTTTTTATTTTTDSTSTSSRQEETQDQDPIPESSGSSLDQTSSIIFEYEYENENERSKSESEYGNDNLLDLQETQSSIQINSVSSLRNFPENNADHSNSSISIYYSTDSTPWTDNQNGDVIMFPVADFGQSQNNLGYSKELVPQNDEFQSRKKDQFSSISSKKSGPSDHHPVPGIQDHVQSQKSIFCKICDKKFRRSSEVSRHERIHNVTEKPYSCSICQKSFAFPDYLKKHFRIHSKANSAAVKEVDLMTAKRSLRSRNQTSTEKSENNLTKNFSCKICHLKFGSINKLYVEHIQSHKENGVFPCQDCSKGFLRIGDLTRHQLVHTGEYPHNCSICPKKYREKKSLTRHQKKIHQN